MITSIAPRPWQDEKQIATGGDFAGDAKMFECELAERVGDIALRVEKQVCAPVEAQAPANRILEHLIAGAAENL